MTLPFNPQPKTKTRRFKPTTKMRGRISPEVYQAAYERSGGCCERCGKAGSPEYGTLQCAHLVRRWKLDETTVNDVAMLCGPSVNTGTCHNWIDYTREGRLWAQNYRKQLYDKYLSK
ncbi:hypothetical protein [Paenibacillus sp. UMB4589-SE434]|uniref:hypothetical protein n=1 Tax=Paenibacillus sp. UMB4589-SE434 TaxID=3046314 RepID=UPI00254DFCCA|nr:hypothetical protein [Paenibacillus sp. UMB4589-SE434]MDK8182078.1 hypothetical protein [Paenibacillus sp. UMB4589-SE434]